MVSPSLASLHHRLQVLPRFASQVRGRDALVRLALSKQFPQADAFWEGDIYVRDQNNQPTPAKISRTKPEDAQQVDSWYEPKSDGRAWYQKPKWRSWWTQKIAPKSLAD